MLCFSPLDFIEMFSVICSVLRDTSNSVSLLPLELSLGFHPVFQPENVSLLVLIQCQLELINNALTITHKGFLFLHIFSFFFKMMPNSKFSKYLEKKIEKII